jgi:AraC-like DNA-binding protein
MARMVLRAVTEVGLDADRLRRDADIEREALHDPDGRVPYVAYMALWAHAGIALPGFGLFVAERYIDAASLGIVGFSASRCSTFADSVDRAVQFIQLVNENTLVCFERTKGGGTITDVPRDPTEPWPAAHAEMALGAFAILGKKWTGRTELPLSASFQHARPAHHTAYRRIFGTDLRWTARTNEVTLPNALLDAPLVASDPELVAFLDRQAAMSMRGLEAEPFLPRLRRWVAEALTANSEAGAPPLHRAARAFGVSARTFQRRLMESGARFDEIVDRERRRIALAALADPNKSVAEAAWLAGYHDHGAFREAVRRWTGCLPSALHRAACESA